MAENSTYFWPWLSQFFTPFGAVLVMLAIAIVVLSSLITPLYILRLHRQATQLSQQLADLLANQSRQQQVDRLKNDRTRKRPRRRRS